MLGVSHNAGPSELGSEAVPVQQSVGRWNEPNGAGRPGSPLALLTWLTEVEREGSPGDSV